MTYNRDMLPHDSGPTNEERQALREAAGAVTLKMAEAQELGRAILVLLREEEERQSKEAASKAQKVINYLANSGQVQKSQTTLQRWSVFNRKQLQKEIDAAKQANPNADVAGLRMRLDNLDALPPNVNLHPVAYNLAIFKSPDGTKAVQEVRSPIFSQAKSLATGKTTIEPNVVTIRINDADTLAMYQHARDTLKQPLPSSDAIILDSRVPGGLPNVRATGTRAEVGRFQKDTRPIYEYQNDPTKISRPGVPHENIHFDNRYRELLSGFGNTHAVTQGQRTLHLNNSDPIHKLMIEMSASRKAIQQAEGYARLPLTQPINKQTIIDEADKSIASYFTPVSDTIGKAMQEIPKRGQAELKQYLINLDTFEKMYPGTSGYFSRVRRAIELRLEELEKL